MHPRTLNPIRQKPFVRLPEHPLVWVGSLQKVRSIPEVGKLRVEGFRGFRGFRWFRV